MRELSTIIADLVATGKEGDHWDFKRCAQAKTGDVVKDIICLANTPRHTGDRYIIYGVDDTGRVLGVKETQGRAQADIVNTLSNAGFAGGVYPDIHLETIELQGRRLEVLVIKDRPEKPYYLQKAYRKEGIQLNPGTVYARVRDSNTSSDQVASSHDIERMWRERFGLDQTPLERVRNYLSNHDDWVETSEDVWYHSQFPEFTISPTLKEPELVRGGETWVRASTSPSAYVFPFRIRFHQTVLAEITCILYDEMRARTPAPQLNRIGSTKGLWFYSLCADTLDFVFLLFLTRTTRDQLLHDGLSGGRLGNAPVIIFSGQGEREAFIEDLTNKPVAVEERHNEALDPEVEDHDRKIIAFSRAVIERFREWKMESS